MKLLSLLYIAFLECRYHIRDIARHNIRHDRYDTRTADSKDRQCKRVVAGEYREVRAA